MVAASIFTLMLILLGAIRRGKPRVAVVVFFVTFVAVALLFKHHATDALNISL
jgi:hypothetical protein